jgi:hypothetical protein
LASRACHEFRQEQAEGCAFLERFRLRVENCDPEVNEKSRTTQIEAISGAPREKPFEYLKLDPPADAGRKRRPGLNT